MTAKKQVEPALQELLKDVLPNFKGKPPIFFLRAPNNIKEAPFIVLSRSDGGERFRSINGPSGLAQVVFRIDVYDVGYYSCRANADKVETALDGFRGIVYHGDDSPRDFTRIAGISLETETELVDETDDPVLYRQSVTYRVTFEQ